MKAKTGKSVNAVKPMSPSEIFEADVADPGKANKIKAKEIEGKKGKYGKTNIKPFKPVEHETKPSDTSKEKPVKTTWVEIKLKDEDGKPVAGMKYEITLPDGSVSKGSTNADGKAKVSGFEPGECKLTLPDVHKTAW